MSHLYSHRNYGEHAYLSLLRRLLAETDGRPDRTGTGTASIFAANLRFDLSEGFPLLTTKKVHLKGIAVELLWFLRGDTNVKYLHDHGITIWDEWIDESGNLGPIYGKQWRDWNGIDQITNVMKSLKDDPFSRRHVVSAWNVADLPHMALMPCHTQFQFYVKPLALRERIRYAYVDGIFTGEMPTRDADREALLNDLGVPDKSLSCHLTQRSADTLLGVPYNIASYSLLTHMFAQQLGYAVGEFAWTGVDTHLYSNHRKQAATQVQRSVRPAPKLVLRKAPSIFEYTPEDISVENYDPHPAISAPVAV